MVKITSLKPFVDDVLKLYGQLLSQKISSSALTPVDTRIMARSFIGTYKFTKTDNSVKFKFTTPFYTKYVHDGTRKMKARPFVNQIIHQEGEALLKKAFQIIDKKWRNK